MPVLYNQVVKRYLKVFLLVFLSMLVTLGIIEIGLRFVNYPYQNCKEVKGVSEFYIGRFDPELGWSYSPNSSAEQNGTTFIFNSEGYRVGDINKKTDFSKPIILVIGDSILFGHGVTFEESFGYKLQKKLGDKFEVLNFSVQGNATDQMYLMMQRQIPKYKPVIVITDFIREHNERNVSQDRRFIFPCMLISGTKPLFGIDNGNLKLIGRPSEYSNFDKFRIVLFGKRVDEAFKFRNVSYQENLTRLIMKEMNEYAEKNKVKLLNINFNTGLTYYQSSSNLKKNTVVIDNGKNEELYLSDKFHPNGKGVSIMVDSFMEKFDQTVLSFLEK